MDSLHEPNDVYSTAMPSPPKISFIPSTAMNDQSDVPPQINQPVYYNFLQNHDLSKYVNIPYLARWSYDSRHEAQQVLPFLYLGPMAIVKDLDFLNRASISMIVAIRSGLQSGASRPLPISLTYAQRSGRLVRSVDVTDYQDLAAKFDDINGDMNSHLQQFGGFTAILVCCNSGNDRSAGIVVAYIMELLGLNLYDAARVVQGNRFCVSFCDALKNFLQSYDEILRARRDVRKSHVSTEISNRQDILQEGRISNKRGHGEDENETMYEENDAERFQGRSFVPFSG